MKLLPITYKERTGYISVPETVREFTDIVNSTIDISYTTQAFQYGSSAQLYIVMLLAKLGARLIRQEHFPHIIDIPNSQLAALEELGLKRHHLSNYLTVYNCIANPNIGRMGNLFSRDEQQELVIHFILNRVESLFKNLSYLGEAQETVYTPENSYWRRKIVDTFFNSVGLLTPYLTDLATRLGLEPDSVNRVLERLPSNHRLVFTIFEQSQIDCYRIVSQRTGTLTSQKILINQAFPYDSDNYGHFRTKYRDINSYLHSPFAQFSLGSRFTKIFPDFLNFRGRDFPPFKLPLDSQESLFRKPILIRI